MFKKLNNKGDTLAIVLIGIFVLSILGTLILGLTATNYNMKINDKQSESAFYYAEKGMDDLYASFGNDVMNSITDSYKYTIEHYTSLNEPAGATKDKAEVNFAHMLREKVTDNFRDGVLKQSSDPINTTTEKELIDKVNAGDYITQANGYTITMTDSTTKPLDIQYYHKRVQANGEVSIEQLSGHIDVNDVDYIKLLNVRIKCESDRGYVAEITSDFEIKIPYIELNFKDTKTPGADLSNLAKYALVCEGYNLHKDSIDNYNNQARNNQNITYRKNYPINIEDGANVTITGSIYADGSIYAPTDSDGITGTTDTGVSYRYYKNDYARLLSKNPSINLGNRSTVTINSKVLYCNNDFVLNTQSTANINNKFGRSTTDSTDSLQFYANNIVTARNTSGATLNVSGGNVIVRDDLELNGDSSVINIRGNYFGYGFRDTNGDGVEDNSNTTSVFLNGVDPTNEHEKSSAMIVNGKNASVNLGGLRKLVLLGRSYIDLDERGTNTSYMTGESISFKGNQDVYLATTTNELSGSLVGSNPISYSQLNSIVNGRLGNGATLSDLRIANPDSVVAKKAGEEVYFYEKNNNPAAQTQYFMNTFTNQTDENKAKIENLRKQLGSEGLNVLNFTVGTAQGFQYYSVGTLMNVGRTVTGQPQFTTPLQGTNMTGFTPSTFVDVVNNRVASLSPALVDLSEKYILGIDNTIDASGLSSEDNPYEYYIDREKLLRTYGSRRFTQPIQLNNNGAGNASIFGTSSERAIELTTELKDILKRNNICTEAQMNGSFKFGYMISGEAGNGFADVEIDAGVVVGESPYTIGRDFTGLVLNYGEMAVRGNNVKINANEELVIWMFKNIPDLNNVLSEDLIGTDAGSESGVVVGENYVKYTDIIEKSNWAKAVDTN